MTGSWKLNLGTSRSVSTKMFTNKTLAVYYFFFFFLQKIYTNWQVSDVYRMVMVGDVTRM